MHIASGCGALAYALFLGRRRDRYGQVCRTIPSYRPHNTTLVIIGFVLLWFGWIGFNGGSGLGINLRAVYAVVNTNIAASCAALTWVLIDFFHSGKWSAVGAASGAVAGLIGDLASVRN